MARGAARGPSARVVLNRKAIDQVRLAIADGTSAIGKAIVTTANPPDATPFGEGLVTHGGFVTYVGAKKTAGWSMDGRQPKKPRAIRVRGTDTILTAAGFGFPARFQEFGTARQPARPFLTPARNAVEPRAAGIMRQAAAYRIARYLGRPR